ncbi:hypothetical protein PPBDW_I30213 [Photobacterium kishitanii]|nr:hypothetical protein PPBDW_I30213 [Photobacterium kishitanii]
MVNIECIIDLLAFINASLYSLIIRVFVCIRYPTSNKISD